MIAEADGPRDQVYGMLAELFIRPPDEETVSTLLPDAESIDIDLLGAEFTEAFRGLRRDSPRPPYESLYREGVLYGESTQQVVRSYSSYDVEPTGSYEGEPPDHIAFELDFMRHLCALEREAVDDEALTSILDAERRFLEGHILPWIGVLEREVQGMEGSGFYGEVTSFTSNWVDEDHRRVTERLMAVGGYP
jgi:TorA maturation chaperone TorD